MKLTVVEGKLLVDGREFVPTNIGSDQVHSVREEDGSLETLFRGHLFNYYDFSELEGYFVDEL